MHRRSSSACWGAPGPRPRALLPPCGPPDWRGVPQCPLTDRIAAKRAAFPAILGSTNFGRHALSDTRKIGVVFNPELPEGCAEVLVAGAKQRRMLSAGASLSK